MCSDDTNRDLLGDADAPTESGSGSGAVEPSDIAPASPKSGWRRRTFLQAAALGTAAAALLNREGLNLGLGTPSVGAAASGFCPDGVTPDLSFLSCTANDVTIDQAGIVQNEPCNCSSGTFSAVVAFPVNNHTGTGRYCIQISIGNGLGVPCQDIILRDSLVNGMPSGSSTAPANSVTTMYGLIAGFPCNSGGTLVCLGAANTPASGACPGECVTVGWSTSSGSANCGSPTKVPGGQCRHQQLCIQGFGASLACTAGCSPTCGGTSTLPATVGAAPVTSGTPFTYTLNGSDGSVQTFGPTAATSVNFTVTPPAGTTSYTVTVCDARLGTNCCRTSGSVSLTTIQIPPPVISITSGPDCAGHVSLSATDSASGVSFTWSATNATPSSGSGASFSTTITPGMTSTITVTATSTTNSSCTNSSSTQVPVNASVSVKATRGSANCSGSAVTLTAKASNGYGPFTFSWTDVTTGSSLGSGTTAADGVTNTLSLAGGTLAPGSNDTIQVTVTDGNGGCQASDQTSQPIPTAVSTSLDTGSSPDCTGHLTFTASASGGTGSYTFAWAIDGSPVANNNTNTLAYPPTVDCNVHTVAVTATDSNGCVSGNTASRTVKQVVTTTVT